MPEAFDNLDDLRTEEGLSPEDLSDLRTQPVLMGDFPENPIDTSHPDIGVGTRQLINFAGGDPKTAERYLQGKGYDAKAIGGFNFAVKKPEETKWQRLDSTKWEMQDVLDVVGDVLSLGGMVTGGMIGAPAGIVGGVAGSAGGAAGMQGVRSTVGQLLGMPTTQEEALGSIGREAVTGALAEVGGRIIGKGVSKVAGKFRKAPPAAAAPAPASRLAAGETAATREEIATAIEGLAPEEKFGLEFIEKVPAQTSRTPGAGAAGGTRRVSGEFQKEPPQSGEIRKWADEWAEQVAGKPGTAFEGKSKEQVAEELYRRMLHGEMPAVGPGRAGPFVDVAKREAQILREQPSLVQTRGFGKRGVMPLGEPYWPKVPTGSEVAFWRDLPADGIQKLFHPDGRVLVLSEQQAKAAKVIVQSAATDTWTPKSKKLLQRLIGVLKWPKETIINMLQVATNRHVGKWMRENRALTTVGLGAAETAIGGTLGGLPGGAAVMDIAGRGLEKVFGRLLSDTSGEALIGLTSRSRLGIPEALKKAAQAAGAGNEELYRAIMWTALKQTDVNEYLQAVAGSRGVNAEGPRVRQGFGS